MRKTILVLVVSLTVSSTGFIAGCQNKKAPVKETVPGQEKTQANQPSSDSALINTPASNQAQAGTSHSGQKFGYINSADLIKLMPETKKADASLQAYVKTLENQFGSLQKNYQKQITDFQTQEKTMVDAIKQTKIKAIQDLEQQMQQSQVTGQQKVAAKREELFKPILDKAEKAVKDVGQENGYDYIFDASTGSFIYAKDSHDVMPLVKTKLGIK